jgi:3-mercaptopyruvate sulfurtransferase SseA
MRKTFITVWVACAIAAAVLAACKAQDNTPGVASSPQAQADAAHAQIASQSDGARRVTIQELQDMLVKGEVVVYDTRPQSEYESGHIKGSLSMPLGEVENRAGELPKDKFIVFYCA